MGLYCGLCGKEWVRLGTVMGLARVNDVSGLWGIETAPSSLVPGPGGDEGGCIVACSVAGAVGSVICTLYLKSIPSEGRIFSEG